MSPPGTTRATRASSPALLDARGRFPRRPGGDGRAGSRASDRHRPGRAAAGRARRGRSRDRPVRRDGRADAGQARWRGPAGRDRRLRQHPRGRRVRPRLPGVQHDRQRHHARTPRSPTSRTPPRTSDPAAASWSRPACPACARCHGRAVPGVPPRRRPPRHRRVRRRHPADVVPPLHARGRRSLPAQAIGAVPLRVAGRARPDGPDRRPAAPRALGLVGPQPVHRRQHAHVSVWEKQV